ncbi:PfkB family carbohydrate kinase [Propionivibrio dicarboxylicus]|uniref:Sugar or nucleoside kinase, ribokinase family n=1 Tax=Propionivibrio dicarboxylicus TaxID=83767 RepID=A0A1G8JBK4_9RHOO|nr:PfkB family carbohydrate kinase [Propionivibrio dicarboxylicus]SDI28639.1 Sugar or nucleoside kinase, ribokinase family [Propionivibrio dicarboxylicus]
MKVASAVTPQTPRMIAVGAVCSATIFQVETIAPPPAKLLAQRRVQLVDGMAISAAYAFARLGGRADIWSRIGDDALGVEVRKVLSDEAFDVSGLQVVPGAATSQVAIIMDRRGDRLVVPFHDPCADTRADWLPLQHLDGADFLHCETRWPEGAEVALRAARARGIPCMVDGDVAPPEVLHRLMPLADYAVFSDAGLAIYAGCEDVETALRCVGREHRGHVGATCGARGYAWLEQDEVRWVAAPAVKVVDTLGAGDVFHGALALALLEGCDVAAAARFACAAASLKCTRFGGRLGCPTRSEVDALVLTMT